MGRARQKVDDLGLRRNPAAIVTSDHRKTIGERARTGKSNISMATTGSGRSTPSSATRRFSSHRWRPSAAAPSRPHVRSGSGKHREFAISGDCIGGRATAPVKASMPFLVTERKGYAPVGAHGAAELYDLAADPLAAHNLAESPAAVVEEMHGLLIQHLRE